MKTLSRFFVYSCVYSCVIGVAVTMLRIPILEAGIQRNRKDEGVVLGKWQPPESKGKRENFLSMEEFKPGDKLAVKIFLEKPREKVMVKLTVKVPEKTDKVSERTIKDGGKYDLLPEQKKVIVYELTEILPDEEAIYVVEIDDKSDDDPVIKTLESSGGYFKFLGKTVSNMANTLLRIPVTISTVLLMREREPILVQTLIIADTEGNVQDTLTSIQEKTIQSPIWLSNDQILFVESHGKVSTLKVIKVDSVKFEGSPEDFGGKPTKGTEPHLTPDQQSIIFRQDSAIISADLSGTQPVPLIQDKEVTKILGVFAEADTESYNLVFSVKEGEDKEIYWLAKVQRTKVISLDRIPYSYHWEMLAKIRLYGKRMLYARRDRSIINEKEHVWNIYLSPSFEQEGQKMTTDLYNDRYPAWSPDGTKIVFVSDQLK